MTSKCFVCNNEYRPLGTARCCRRCIPDVYAIGAPAQVGRAFPVDHRRFSEWLLSRIPNDVSLRSFFNKDIPYMSAMRWIYCRGSPKGANGPRLANLLGVSEEEILLAMGICGPKSFHELTQEIKRAAVARANKARLCKYQVDQEFREKKRAKGRVPCDGKTARRRVWEEGRALSPEEKKARRAHLRRVYKRRAAAERDANRLQVIAKALS